MRTLQEAEYKNNYINLEKNIFLGFLLDEDNNIKQIYSCGIEENKPYCLRGGINENDIEDKTIYNINKKTLNSVYNNCTFYADKNSYECVGTTLANIDYNGNTNIYSNPENLTAGSCRASTDGSSSCSYRNI